MGIPNQVEFPIAEALGDWQDISSLAECIEFCEEKPGCNQFRYYPNELKKCRPNDRLLVGRRIHSSEATSFYRSCDMGNDDNNNIS